MKFLLLFSMLALSVGAMERLNSKMYNSTESSHDENDSQEEDVESKKRLDLATKWERDAYRQTIYKPFHTTQKDDKGACVSGFIGQNSASPLRMMYSQKCDATVKGVGAFANKMKGIITEGTPIDYQIQQNAPNVNLKDLKTPSSPTYVVNSDGKKCFEVTFYDDDQHVLFEGPRRTKLALQNNEELPRAALFLLSRNDPILKDCPNIKFDFPLVIERLLERKNDAPTKIQKVFRGYEARKKYKEMKLHKGPEGVSRPFYDEDKQGGGYLKKAGKKEGKFNDKLVPIENGSGGSKQNILKKRRVVPGDELEIKKFPRSVVPYGEELERKGGSGDLRKNPRKKNFGESSVFQIKSAVQTLEEIKDLGDLQKEISNLTNNEAIPIWLQIKPSSPIFNIEQDALKEFAEKAINSESFRGLSDVEKLQIAVKLYSINFVDLAKKVVLEKFNFDNSFLVESVIKNFKEQYKQTMQNEGWKFDVALVVFEEIVQQKGDKRQVSFEDSNALKQGGAVGKPNVETEQLKSPKKTATFEINDADQGGGG